MRRPARRAILLIDTIADPIAGSSFFDGAGVNIGTDLFNSSVTCNLPISKTVSAGPYLAKVPAQSVTYTIHVGNPTAVSISGLVVGDSLPAGLTATAISSPTDGTALCSLSPLGCIGTAQPDPIGLDVVITADYRPVGGWHDADQLRTARPAGRPGRLCTDHRRSCDPVGHEDGDAGFLRGWRPDLVDHHCHEHRRFDGRCRRCH